MYIVVTWRSGPVDLARQLPVTRRANTVVSRERKEGGRSRPRETRERPVLATVARDSRHRLVAW